MAPPVHADLVPAAGDLAHRVGVELAVERLDEEGGRQVQRVKLVEQPREGGEDRGMASERGLWIPRAALQLAGFPEVVEGEQERAGPGARPTGEAARIADEGQRPSPDSRLSPVPMTQRTEAPGR